MSEELYRWRVALPGGSFPIRIARLGAADADTQTLHRNEFLRFHRVLEGEVCWVCSDRPATLGPGDVFFAGWMVPHQLRSASADALWQTLELEPSYVFSDMYHAGFGQLGDDLVLSPAAFGSFIREDGEMNRTLARLEELMQTRPFGWELTVKGLMLELVGGIFSRHCDRDKLRSSKPEDDGAARYTRWILDHIASNYAGNINLDQIAGELGLTKGYICRLFRQHTGTTIINYVNHLRCCRAISLVEGGCSVTQAALQVGFNDYNYFSRVFKKTIGKRPSDFVGQTGTKT